MTQLIVKGRERRKSKERARERERDKVVQSWTHTDTVTRLLEIIWRAGVYIACRFAHDRVRESTRFGGSGRGRGPPPCSAFRATSVSSVASPNAPQTAAQSHFGRVDECPSLAVTVVKFAGRDVRFLSTAPVNLYSR